MISHNDYLEKYWSGVSDVYGYQKWFESHLLAEFRIGDDWYPCIPLSDLCVYPFEDYHISVITRNGIRIYLNKSEFRLIA